MRDHLKTMLKTYFWKLTKHHYSTTRKKQDINTTQPAETLPTAVVVQDSEEHWGSPLGAAPDSPLPGVKGRKTGVDSGAGNGTPCNKPTPLHRRQRDGHTS